MWKQKSSLFRSSAPFKLMSIVKFPTEKVYISQWIKTRPFVFISIIIGNMTDLKSFMNIKTENVSRTISVLSDELQNILIPVMDSLTAWYYYVH